MQPKTPHQSAQVVMKAWNRVAKLEIRRLVLSMRRRCTAVFACRRGIPDTYFDFINKIRIFQKLQTVYYHKKYSLLVICIFYAPFFFEILGYIFCDFSFCTGHLIFTAMTLPNIVEQK